MNVIQHVCPANMNVVTLDLQGRLDAAGEAVAAPVVMKAVGSCQAGVLLDMAHVDFVSSAGLRLLVKAHKEAVAAGRKLGLLKVQPGVYKILKLAALEQALNIFDDETDAAKKLWPTA